MGPNLRGPPLLSVHRCSMSDVYPLGRRPRFGLYTRLKRLLSKYIVVNASFAYNLLLGQPYLNMLGAVASTTHMKMKFPSSKEGVITIKADQRMARKCYESNLKNRRGTYVVTIQPGWSARLCELCLDRLGPGMSPKVCYKVSPSFLVSLHRKNN